MKRKTVILAVLILLLLAFIWGNSVQSIPDSRDRSLSVMVHIQPFLEPFVGKGNVTNHLVRKLAHLCEYSLLGLLLTHWVRLWMQPTPRRVLHGMLFGLAVAVTDETIQIFSHRGSQVQNANLDFCGVIAGTLLELLLSAIVRRVKRSQN